MRALRLTIALTAALALSGCKPAFDIRLASEKERLPSPAFIVEERDRPEARPEYSTVQLLDPDDGAVLWHLRAAPFGTDASQGRIEYGVTPKGFEAVVEPTPLEPGRRYVLVVTGTPHGQLRFEADDEGRVEAVD